MESNSLATSQGHLNVKVKAFQIDFYAHIDYYTMTEVYNSLTGKHNSSY